VWCRIWVNPEPGQYDLAYTLAQAQRFAKKGYRIYLDFHFSDTWVSTLVSPMPVSCIYEEENPALTPQTPGGSKQAIHTGRLDDHQCFRTSLRPPPLRQNYPSRFHSRRRRSLFGVPRQRDPSRYTLAHRLCRRRHLPNLRPDCKFHLLSNLMVFGA
jgi:hypothetical protein